MRGEEPETSLENEELEAIDTSNRTSIALVARGEEPEISLENKEPRAIDTPSRTSVTLAGRVEATEISDADFEKQRRLYERQRQQKQGKAQPKKKRLQRGDPADIDGFQGPWAGFVNENKGEESVVQPSEEEVNRYLAEKSRFVPTTLSGHVTLGQEKSIFHGKEERDYLGRSYMFPPHEEGVSASRERGEFDCYAPKKLQHVWTGHTKGVNSIRFLPKTGHLLLSAAQDQRIKLWSVYGERECLRTFYGHNKPVREVNFDSDGARFASCSYDKAFKYWDTETGKCLFGKEINTIPYCVRIHPTESPILLVGTADKKVMQWDSRSGEVALEYNQHNGAVNTITFFNDNRNFVTSSDDRTLRVWDYGNGNSVKTITDPDMHSMPYAAHHPTEPFIAFQSLANQIQIYSLHDHLTPRNKHFIGHSTSGYACQLGFSPDGRYIYSGDGRGQIVIWNWQNGQQVRRLDAHPQVCIGVEWDPQHSSRMASCSWDGTIKLWE